MNSGLHILSFKEKLKEEKPFLKSLLCRSLQKRKLILQKASNRQAQLLKKSITLFLRGEITVNANLISRLRKSKKLQFIEQTFRDLKKDPNLKKNLLALAGIIQLFVKLIIKK